MTKEINEPKCPYCGCEDEMVDVDHWSVLEDDIVTYDWILQCPRCEKEFHYQEKYELVKAFSCIKEV